MFEPQLCNLKILNGTSGVTVFENHKDLSFFFFFFFFGLALLLLLTGVTKIKHLQNDLWPRRDARTCIHVHRPHSSLN